MVHTGPTRTALLQEPACALLSFTRTSTSRLPYILNFLDALAGIYHGGPLSGNVFHANTIAVSKDPVALDTYQLGLINRVTRSQ